MSIESMFLKFSADKLTQFVERIEVCVAKLDDRQVWTRGPENSNAIGNLMLHLNGNVTQWLVAAFRHCEDSRDRPAEFATRQLVPKKELIELLDKTLQEAAAVLSGVSESDLLAAHHIQGYTVTGLHAIYQVIEHFGLHYGQVVYITKLLRGEDLGFYKELNETGRINGAGH